MICLTSATKKGVCKYWYCLGQKQGTDGGKTWFKPLLHFIQVQLCSCLVHVLRWKDPVIRFNVQHQPSPGVNITCCIRVSPTILSSQCGDKWMMPWWWSSTAHLHISSKQLQCREWGALRALNRNACLLLPKHSSGDTCRLKWVCGMRRPFTTLNLGESSPGCIQRKHKSTFSK